MGDIKRGNVSIIQHVEWILWTDAPDSTIFQSLKDMRELFFLSFLKWMAANGAWERHFCQRKFG